MSSADEREDEKDNKSNKKNNWKEFRKEIITGVRDVLLVTVFGSIFLYIVGDKLFIYSDEMKNIKENNEILFDAIHELESQPFGALDTKKAPYTRVNSNEKDDSFFTTSRWSFPYKNILNEKSEWEFNMKEPNWETAKPVLYLAGDLLEKMFSGSYGTGRWIMESVRKFGNKQAVKSNKTNSKFMPSMLLWVFGLIIYIVLTQGIWFYSSFSVMISGVIYLIFNIIKIFNIPDPPKPKDPEKDKKKDKEPPSDAEKAAKAAREATKIAQEAMFDMTPAGQTAKAAEKSGLSSTIKTVGVSIKDGIIAIISAIWWTIKRLFKSWVLFVFYGIFSSIGGAVNSIWQPSMLIGWLLSPLFDDGPRKLILHYIGKQKIILAILFYLIFLKACVNNLHNYNPTYIGVAGVIVLLMVIFGIIK